MIYWVFVVAPLWLVRGIWRYFERTVIDMGMNVGLERTVAWSAKVVQEHKQALHNHIFTYLEQDCSLLS